MTWAPNTFLILKKDKTCECQISDMTKTFKMKWLKMLTKQNITLNLTIFYQTKRYNSKTITFWVKMYMTITNNLIITGK